MHCSAEDFEEGELMKGVKAGDKLKVKESRTVWHSPKHKVITRYAVKNGVRMPKHGVLSPQAVDFGYALSRLSRAYMHMSFAGRP